MKTDIKSMLPEEIKSQLEAMGQPAFRAKQIFKWLNSGVKSFDEMTNIPKKLAAELAEKFYICAPEILRKQVSQIDGTIKYLWRLEDGNSVESVVMSYAHGNTICISTQVGCRMGCAFCASTIGGLVRSLEPSEMVNQVLFAQKDSGKKISNIVLMGIGEPLDNFDNVIKFLSLINNPDGMNIGMRHISLSTCGLAEKVDKLGDYNLQLTLSVSLHAPDNSTRDRIMPVNKKYPVEQVLNSCSNYFKKTGRRISYEYAMIDGVNDTPEHARLLADRLAGTGSHVNLILLNYVDERSLRPSTPKALKEFTGILKERGVNVTVRRRLGSDIDASCGQLRRKVIDRK
jgi:23S rRNA (adenine2503-C2)-methyltransferase